MPRRNNGGADAIYDEHRNPRRMRSNSAVHREQRLTLMYIRLLSELATNRFKWTGLPDSIDQRYLETTLFKNALSVCFYDNRIGKLLALRGTGAGNYNYQEEPTQFTVYGAGYPGKYMSADDAVPIWANYLRMPDWDIVDIYSQRLAWLDRTIEINSVSARRTKVLAMTENQRMTVENINRQLDEGQGAIKITRDLGNIGETIQALDLGVNPESIVNLDILRTRQWNQCMGLLGIENANQDKKERLVASEVDANNDQTSMMRQVNLNSRREAAKQITDMFGEYLDKGELTVEFYTDVERQAKMPEVGFGERMEAMG